MRSDADIVGKSISFVERLLGDIDDAATTIVFEDRRRGADVWTRRRLRTEVDGLAAALRVVAGPGDRAVVVLPTGPDYVVAVLACLASGVIAVPASAAPGAGRPAERERLAAIARDCSPKVVIALPDAAPSAAIGDAVLLAPTARGEGHTDHVPAPEDVAVLQYTSGSTSSPKGVMVTAANLKANLETLTKAFGADRSSTIVSWLPLFHDMGLVVGLLLPLYAGGRLVLTSPFDFIERPRRWFELITRWRGTITLAPNFAYQLCMERIADDRLEGLDLSSLTMMGSGAEPIRATLMSRFVERFAAVGLPRGAMQNCYGLAEATLLVSSTPFGAGARSTRFASDALAHGSARSDTAGTPIADCGPPVSGCAIAIVDPGTLRRVEPGCIGEIWVAGPSVSPGYWRRPDASTATMAARLPDEGDRWLRTGDLGFFYNGGLFVTGRHKDLIILRGQNIAPQDIEDRIEQSVPGLRPGRIAAFPVAAESGEAIGVAAECARGQTGGHDVILKAIRAVLAEAFEAPSLVLLLRAGDLPRTTSGKLRRSACLPAWRDGTIVPLAAHGAAPGPETMDGARPEVARIAALWRDILGHLPAPNDDFFMAGGQSLTGATLAARIESAFGWTPPPGFVFLARTPAAQALALAEGLAQGEQPSAAAPHTLTGLQQALWTEHRLNPDNVANNIGIALTLRGRLDIVALREAFVALAGRHPALHSVVVAEDGPPTWQTPPDLEPALVHLWTEDGENVLRETLARPFDLAAEPPLRACVVTADGETFRLLVALHHIAADGLVAPIIVGELGHLYDAARTATSSGLVAPPPRPADPPSLEADRAFWRTTLAGAPEQLPLATDRARIAPHDGAFWRAERIITAATQRALSQLAASLGITQAATGLALFAALLHRTSGGAGDVVIGVPVSLRPASAAGWVGHCMNTVPLRLAMRPETGLRDLLEQAGAALAVALPHARLPFAALVEMLRPPRDALRTPFFRAMFNHRGDEPVPACSFGDLEVGRLDEMAAAAPFDITLEMIERSGRTHIALDLAGDIFDRATAEQLIDDYVALAEALAAGGAALGTLLPVAPPPPAPFPNIGISAQAAVRAHARSHPDGEAGRCGSEAVTYAALDAWADTIAAALRATAGWDDAPAADRIVGLAIARGVALPAAVLGIWRAGAALLPLDPELPPARMSFMLRDSAAALVLTDDAGLDAPVPVLPLPAAPKAPGRDDPHRAAEPHPQQLAYVLYTSGSTGAPKGVAITHDALARHLDDFCATHRISAADVLLQSSTIGFDVFLHELLPALMKGGRVVMRGPAAWSFDTLNAALASGVTFARIPTSFWRQWLAHAPAALPALRQITVGGEALPGDALAAWHACGLRDVALANLYGPTETTVACLHHVVTPADAGTPVVSIGRPYPNRTASIRDRAGNPVARGGTGELCVGGPTVARNYLGRPGATAERFVPDPDGAPGTRLYRTGDLASWRADGSIQFLGRMDAQIKLRGIRIEPAEIEAALRAVAGVDEAVVLLHDIGPAPLLIGYVAGRVDVECLRRDLAERLPASMVPARFVVLETFPLLASGKIDRAALPSPPAAEAGQDEAATPTERVLRDIWREVLDHAAIGTSDDFFALGGDSILSLRVVARAREAGLELSPRQVFEAPTIAGLSRLARALNADAFVPNQLVLEARQARSVDTPVGIDAATIEAFLPATPLQRGLLLLATQSAQDPYHAQHVFTVEGLHDPEALRAAWAAAVARHATLRTGFVWPEPDLPAMIVHRTARPRLHEHDWRHHDEAAAAAALAADWAAAKARGFDFAAPGPELRLIRRDESRYWLVWRLHHAQIDGWSMAVVLDEIARGITSHEHAPPFARYVDWLAARDTGPRLDAWRKRLAPIEAPTPLPRARPIPTPLPYAEQTLPFVPQLQDALREGSRRHGVTRGSLLHAAWAWLLSRHAGATRVVFGVTLSGRPETVPDVERIAGLFINTMPLIVTLDPAQPVAAWLASVQSDMLDLMDDADLPAHALQAQSVLPPGAALFDSLVVIQNFPFGQALREGRGGLSLRHLTPDREPDGIRHHHGRNHYGLSLVVQPVGLQADDPDRLEASLSYATDRYDHATAGALLRQFASALMRLCRSASDAPLASLSPAPGVLSPDARARGSDGSVAPEVGVLASVARRAEVEPHGIALSTRGATLTWSTLWERVGAHAARLRKLNVGPETLVATCLPRGFDVVAWLLAIWRVGGAYMPLDPAHPPARRRDILERSGCHIAVAGREEADWLPAAVTRLEPDGPNDAPEPPVMPAPTPPHPAQTAYVIHTSGSTGRPKGVAVSHAALEAYLDGLPSLLPSGAMRAAWVSSPAADLGHTMLLGALRHGWTLHIPAEDDLFDPHRFAASMRDGAVDILKITPSHLRAVLESGDALPARCLVLGGEAASPALLTRIATLRPDCLVVNHYGPTETTVGILAGHVSSASATPALGRPLAHARVTLRAHDGGGAELGVPGEICCAGRQVARGYLGAPALTAERYVPDDAGAPGSRLYRTGDLGVVEADGNVRFLGRVDAQAKINGVRVEPSEVETVLAGLPGVDLCAVQARAGKDGRVRLYAWVVGDVDPIALRADLSRQLPGAMVPAAIASVADLPLNASGKLDLGRLLSPADTLEPTTAAERRETPRETLMREIWQIVLKREEIGLHEDFFALGGDSIASLQIISRARESGLYIAPRDVFANPTIAALAAVAREGHAVSRRHVVTDVDLPPTPIQRRFFERHPHGEAHWNQAVVLRAPGDLDEAAFGSALAAVVARHDALRLRFHRHADGWRQRVPAETRDPFVLRCEDLRAAPDVEDAFADLRDRCHRAMDLEVGPLLAALYVRLPGDEGRLMLAIHHLAVDGVSWRVLIEDLCAFLEGRALPAQHGTSWSRWTQCLAVYAAQRAPRYELDWWRGMLADADDTLPLGEGPADTTIGASRETVVRFDAAETAALSEHAAGAWRMRAEAILVAALVQTLSAWRGRTGALLEMEGHGREDLIDGVDLSRTVGWFTTRYPLWLPLDAATSQEAALAAAKAALRAVPARGFHYGLLVPDGLRPQVSFNYLGRFDAEGGAWAMLRDGVDGGSAPSARMAYALDIRAIVLGGTLSVSWRYSPGRIADDDARALADGFAARLRALVAYAIAHPAPRDTGDFPLAGLDRDGFESLGLDMEKVADLYVATPLQTGLLMHAQEPTSVGGVPDARARQSYVNQLRLTLPGHIEIGPLSDAWRAVVARHDVLRTAFVSRPDGQPLQCVRRTVDLPIVVMDWRDVGDDYAKELRAWCEADLARGFDPAVAPLLRVALLRRPDGRLDLVWTHHHVLADGWSMGRLFNELARTYSAIRAGTTMALPPARRFRDYVAWLAAKTRDDGWWQTYLEGVGDDARLLDAIGTRDEGEPGTVERRPLGALMPRLEAMARHRRLTLNTLLQAAWALVLSRFAGRRHIVFGMTVAGRPPDLPGSAEAIGLFINTLPLRVDVSAAARLDVWLNGLQVASAELAQRSHTSLADVQRLAGQSGQSLFDSLLVFQNYPIADAMSGVMRPDEIDGDERTHYPATLTVTPGERARVRWRWDGTIIPAAVAAGLLDAFMGALTWLAAAGDVPVGDFVLPGVALDAASARPSQADAGPATFRDVLSRIAAHPRDRLAVVCGDERIDYATLVSRASRVSRRLGPSAEQRMGLCTGRSAGLVWGLLGIMGSGAAHVPLDPAYPRARLAHALDDAGITRIVVDAIGVAALGDLAEGRELVRLEDIVTEGGGEVDATLPAFCVPQRDQLAYVIYTSGSTGVPKGVGITHGSLANLLDATRDIGFGPSDCWTLFHSFAFDFSIWEIFGALTHGGRLVVVPQETTRDPLAFHALLRAEHVTVLNQTPSGFAPLLQVDSTSPAKLDDLRLLIFGGEALPSDLAAALHARGVAMWNLYGPTETTILSSAAPVTPTMIDGVASARLGAPLAGERLYVLGEDGLAVPEGGTGELCIGGVGLARGYLGRPSLTAERFAPDPQGRSSARLYRTGDLVRADIGAGCSGVTYLGRVDHQVKVRGHRIELGEIEAALRAVPGVADAAVRLHGPRLVGYVTGTADPEAVRTRLGERLPSIMVPQAIVGLDALPLTPSGKLDRSRLNEPDIAISGAAPRNATEATICDAFAEVLRQDRVYRDSMFFALGGDSIGAMRMSAALSTRFGTTVPVADIFRHPTPAGLAEILAARLVARADATSLESLFEALA